VGVGVIAQGGKNVYGFRIGILHLETRFPRIPGDMVNATTFPFPVLYRRVEGASPQRVVREQDPRLLAPFLEGARALEREGVAAITTNCGFLAMFQREMAAAVGVPVFTSSLMQVPLVHRMLAPGRAVGILTVSAGTLGPAQLEGAGIGPDIPLAIYGLDSEEEFSHVIIDDVPRLDVERARAEHVRVARRMVAERPDVGAVVLECTNMPPYAGDIQAATGLPVFDIVTMVRWVHATLTQSAYGGLL
jgi:Asp/Glu/hydantoin racemase